MKTFSNWFDHNKKLAILLFVAIVTTLTITSGCAHSWQTVRAFPTQIVEQPKPVVSNQLDYSHNHNHFVIHKDKDTSWHLVYDKSTKFYFFMSFITKCSENKMRPMYMTIDSVTLEFQYNLNESISGSPDCFIFVMAAFISDSRLLTMLETQGISMLSIIAKDHTISLSIPPGVKHLIKKEFGLKSNL